MAKKLDDLLRLEGVVGCAAWRPMGKGKKPDIIDAKGEMMEHAVDMASAFCEFDLFTAQQQCAVYERYTSHEHFFPASAIFIRGNEYSVIAVYSNKGDHMVSVFVDNTAKPDFWKLTEEMMEVEVS